MIIVSRAILAASLVGVALATSDCCGGNDKVDKDKDKDKALTDTSEHQKAGHDPAGTTATMTAAPPTHATPEATGATTPGAMGNDGLPLDIPATRSKVPTQAEWDAVPREITVARSTPLACETKMLREWLRVSCRTKNKAGGSPTTVKTKESGGVEAFTFGSGGITSVVVPVLRGKRYTALFGWTDMSQVLVVDWTGGIPRPSIKFTDD